MSGPASELLKIYGLSAEKIEETARKVMVLKRT
jgi:hypothetical protein